MLIDLFDGHRYAVQMIFPAGPRDREFDVMPDTAIQTWPAGKLSEENWLRFALAPNMRRMSSASRSAMLSFSEHTRLTLRRIHVGRGRTAP